MRKHEAIDLMKLYSLGSHNGWNEVLTECYDKRDIKRLAKLRYQIQAGMDDLSKLKLNGPDIIEWYCRLVRSIEITAKRIVKRKHPMPGDNNSFNKNLDELAAKRKRDEEFNRFMHLSAY